MRQKNESNPLTILLPFFCIVLSGIVVYYQYARLKILEERRAALSEQVQLLESSIEEYQFSGVEERIPAVPATIEEQNAFLDGLRKLALETDVTIESWRNMPPPQRRSDEPVPEQYQNVIVLPAALELSGTYQNVNLFLSRLHAAPRLANLTNVRWYRGNDPNITRFAATITRYVTNLPVPPPASHNADDQGDQDHEGHDHEDHEAHDHGENE